MCGINTGESEANKKSNTFLDAFYCEYIVFSWSPGSILDLKADRNVISYIDFKYKTLTYCMANEKSGNHLRTICEPQKNISVLLPE